MELRRLKSKVASEKDAIGQLVYPLLRSGGLAVNLPEVDQHMATIDQLEIELESKQRELESLRLADVQESDQLRSASIKNVDNNATSQALSDQSARDAQAEEKQGNPVEEGGQG